MNALDQRGRGSQKDASQKDGNFWFFWSLGSVVGSAWRLMTGSGWGEGPRRGRATDRELNRIREQAGGEVRQLERELERLHETIAGGVVGRGAALPSMIDEARVLRERLHSKQEDLVRVDRHLARERRLQPIETRAPREAERRERGLFGAGEKRAAGDKRRPKLEQRRKAAMRIVRSAKHASRAAAVAFVGFAEELFVDDADRRRAAVMALSQTPSKASFALLRIALDDEHERVQLAALNALGSIDAARASKECRRFLRHRHGPLRLAALRGLSQHRDALDHADLARAIEDPEVRVRAAAADILGFRRDRDSLQLLTFALSDHEPSVRVAAAQAIGNRGDDSAVLSLFRLLDDEVPAVREIGIAALRALVGSEVDEIGADLEGAERIEALKRWWRAARVDKVMERRLGPRDPIQAVVAPTMIEETLDDGPRRPRDVEEFETAAPAPEPVAARAPAPAAPVEEAHEEPEEEVETPDLGIDLAADDDAADEGEVETPDLGIDLGADDDAAEEAEAETPDLGIGGDDEDDDEGGIDFPTPDLGIGGDDDDDDADEGVDLGIGGDDDDEDDDGEYESI